MGFGSREKSFPSRPGPTAIRLAPFPTIQALFPGGSSRDVEHNTLFQLKQ